MVLDPTPGNKLKSLTVGFQSFACEGALEPRRKEPCKLHPAARLQLASPGGSDYSTSTK
jgi:hypothetical protein